MLMLNWPVIIVSTVAMYVLLLLSLPFSPGLATVLLFMLIGFWSRLPGAGIPDPTWILYNLDLVDLFTLIIAINMGVPAALLFLILTNMIPRFGGFYPSWICVLYDTGAQAVACLFIPFLHVMAGGNILVSMIIYTTIRAIVCMPLSYIFFPRPIVQWVLEWTTALFGAYLANVLYAKFFGSFFDNLLQEGAKFNWILFLFATVVILIFAVTVFGFSPKKASIQAGKSIVKIARKRIKKGRKRSTQSAHQKQEMDEMKRIKDSL